MALKESLTSRFVGGHRCSPLLNVVHVCENVQIDRPVEEKVMLSSTALIRL